MLIVDRIFRNSGATFLILRPLYASSPRYGVSYYYYYYYYYYTHTLSGSGQDLCGSAVVVLFACCGHSTHPTRVNKQENILFVLSHNVNDVLLGWAGGSEAG